MHALDHGAVLRRHQPGRLRAADAERMHGLLRIEPKSARRAGRGREHADGRAGVPALADMFLAHALADARADLVARDGGGEEFAAGETVVAFRRRDQRRQRHRADMQHGLAVHVVEFEALHLGAVGERRMRRRQALVSAPDRCGARGIDAFERPAQDLAPFEIGAVNGAAERIENQQLDALAHFGGDAFIAESRNEFRNRACVDVVSAGVFGHAQSLSVIPGPSGARSPESIFADGGYGFRARRCAAPRNDEALSQAERPVAR